MVRKHPVIFKEADVLVINKSDLADVMEVSIEALVKDANTVKPGARVVITDAKHGKGIEDEIAYVVDINPYRHGKFMPGTGHEIAAPDRIRGERPDVVIIMNAIYRDEIGKDLERLGAEPRILALQ